MEKRNSNVLTFDATPCFNATLDDLDMNLFQFNYLPKTMPADELRNDKREVKYQLSSLGFYDIRFDCPTNAGVLLFAKNLRRFFPGAYVQYVRYKGKTRAGEILMEHEFKENLFTTLQELDTFIKTTIVNRRPIPVSSLREETVVDYPDWATRELLMNAICHRDYSSNGPIQFYQYDDRIEILNHGGLYGRATIDNFPYVNDYRNLVIAEAMKVLGYVNRQSRGVFRVQEDLNENENGEPQYDFSFGTAVMVVEHKSAIPDRLIQAAIEQGLISSESDIKSSQMGENMGKNTQKPPQMGENVGKNTQKCPFPTLTVKNVFELIRQNPTIKYVQIEENLGIDDNTVQRSIAWLKDNGYINKEHSKVKGVWQLI
jgi:ATP-dependent DNA helicase RecG